MFRPRRLLLALLAAGVSIGSVPRLFAQKDEIDLVGHAHIDASWLWPRSETIHEVLPLTFESVHRMMQKHPDFVFAQSSAQYYKWMELYYPEVFAAIKEKVASG